ncbi:MAG: glycoside hydrolase family 55 protein [Spirochaetaceae bacterium]|nr:glycoside hydrolase family 55 protein [Spirochaetaceae bacterium]
MNDKAGLNFNYGSQLYYDWTPPPSREPDVEPYAGGLRFKPPPNFGDQPYADLGVLDVSAPPFSADPRGECDCTEALNEAIRTAQRYHLVCWFPLGKYLIHDTLRAQQFIWWDDYPYREYRVTARMYPVVMMGERREEGGAIRRPEIFLAPSSAGFGFPDAPKPVIDVYYGKHSELYAQTAPASIGNMITGINITVGEGNAGAMGVRFYAAQGCSIEDCTINAGDGYCGIWGSAGNGGSHSQNRIIGGRVGIDVSRGTPGSVIEGFVFDHQKNHAVMAGAKQGITFVGCHIMSNSMKPPVVSLGGGFELMEQGQLSLIDCIVEFDKEPAAGTIQAAVSSRESLYLRNCYFNRASHCVLNPDGSEAPGNPRGWTRLGEFAHGIDSMPMWGGVYKAPLYLDGKRLDSRTWLAGGEEGTSPPADLLSKHRYHLPLWHELLEHNVKQAGAAGDGRADDTAALQRAIDKAGDGYVFLPKGYYRVTGPLKLRADTKLIGVAQNLSQILVTQESGAEFTKSPGPVPALDTPDVPQASVVLAYCGIVTSREMPRVYALHWRCAGDSVLRNFAFYADPGYRITWMTRERSGPWIIVSGNGGGKWYNFWCDITQGGKDYRILSIRGSHQPFAIYACNPEHSRSDYEMEILDSRNIAVYGLKSECNSPDLLIRNSDNIALFTKGGDASAPEGKALINIENSANVILSLLNDYRVTIGHDAGFFSGHWYHPSLWHMLKDSAGTEKPVLTEPWERPCMYKKGEYRDIF